MIKDPLQKLAFWLGVGSTLFFLGIAYFAYLIIRAVNG